MTARTVPTASTRCATRTPNRTPTLEIHTFLKNQRLYYEPICVYSKYSILSSRTLTTGGSTILELQDVPGGLRMPTRRAQMAASSRLGNANISEISTILLRMQYVCSKL